jgi:uncharacterized membrane protein YoaK (UPF0700 family)
MVQPHQSDRVMATPQSAVASSAQVAAQAQERLAAGLAMIAGYVDAYGYITFKAFVSFMSGNTTQTGFQTGQGHVAAAMPSLLPIGSFVIGAFTGTLLTHSGTPQARRRLFGVVAAVLAVSLTFVTGTLIRMGTHLALALTRAPLQGAQGSWDTHGRRAFLLLGIWASFLIGALLGGAATSRFGVWVLLLPLLILLALAVFSRPQSANPDSSA